MENKIFLSMIILIILLNKKSESFLTTTGQPNLETLSPLNKTYIKMLKIISKVFKELKIPFFLSSGTLLGYFREGKFLEHDYDMDIGIFAKDFTNDIIKKMEANGFVYYRKFGTFKNGLELSFYFPNTEIKWKAKVDIFLHYYDDKGKSIYWTSQYKKKRLKYKVSKFNLKKVNFMGVPCWIPNPTVKLLEEHYGYDWMIPRKHNIDYHYSSSPKSLCNE